MAESDLHRNWMVTSIGRFKKHFAGQPVYVSGNLFIYFVKGDTTKCVAPDTFVVKDCDPGPRRVFKIWEEEKVPNAVLETTSSKTRREDEGKKKRLYARLKIPEYFLYDPLGDWLRPALQGYRLTRGRYAPLEADAEGRIISEQLGITFQLEAGQLAMFETATGKRLLSDEEAAAEESRRADEESRRAAEESRRADQESRRADQESRRANEESRRANEAEQRLAREAAARKALEEELARLRAAKRR
jgi:hypothetical protein